MVPSKTSFVIMFALGHTRLWLQSILHRGCSRAQVFSINLHFCFVSAHQSFLPGDGWGGSVAPSPSPEGSSKRESRNLFSQVSTLYPQKAWSTEISLLKGSAQQKRLTNGFLYVILVPRKGCSYWCPTKQGSCEQF